MRKHWTLCVLLLAAGACERSSAPRTDGHEPACGDSLTLFDGQNTAVAIAAFSGEMVVGGTQALHAKEFAWGTGYWTAGPAIPVSWCSANADVATVDGSQLHAMAVGSALIYAYDSTGRADTATVQVGTATYDLTFIGSDVGDSSIAVAMNDSGDVILRAPSGSVLWRDHVLTDLASCDSVAAKGGWEVTRLNNLGQVICPPHHIWENGSIRKVTLPHLSSSVTALNDSGAIAGWYQYQQSFHAFVIRGTDTTRYDLGGTDSEISLINNAGTLAGLSSDGLYHYMSILTPPDDEFVQVGDRYSEPHEIALNGDVVGSDACSPGGQYPLPFVWNKSGRHPLARVTCAYPEKPTDMYGVALGINDNGQVVGTVGSPPRGVLWQNGHAVYLDEVLTDTSWLIDGAVAINNLGQILAQAHNTAGQSGAVLLVPH